MVHHAYKSAEFMYIPASVVPSLRALSKVKNINTTKLQSYIVAPVGQFILRRPEVTVMAQASMFQQICLVSSLNLSRKDYGIRMLCSSKFVKFPCQNCPKKIMA